MGAVFVLLNKRASAKTEALFCRKQFTRQISAIIGFAKLSGAHHFGCKSQHKLPRVDLFGKGFVFEHPRNHSACDIGEKILVILIIAAVKPPHIIIVFHKISFPVVLDFAGFVFLDNLNYSEIHFQPHLIKAAFD